VSVLVVAGLTGPTIASAQTCLEALEPLLEDTSDDCIGIPSNPKFFEASTFSWGGSGLLAINTGNELKLWNIDAPQNPVFAAASALNVPNQGDSDYDLLSYSFCDECRWGVAVFKLGISLFDLGTGNAPGFDADLTYFTSSEPMGAFTFEHAGQQYLVAQYLPDDCGGDATLYRFDGIYQGQFEAIGCVNVPDWNVKIVNGFRLEGAGQSIVYLGFSNRRVYQFRIVDSGADIRLEYQDLGDDVPLAYLMRGKGMALDLAHNLAVAALKTGEMRIYDISDPADPVIIAARSGKWDLAAIRYPFIWVADSSSADSSVTWDITDPSEPQPLDPDFWNPSHPWNSHNDHCEWPGGAVFSGDGSTLYFPRYSVVQMIGFEGCDPTISGDGFEIGDTSGWSTAVH